MRDASEAGWGNRVASLALFGLCLLPFLVPLRTLPTSSFYAEWLAFALGLAALPALAGRAGLIIPRAILLPTGLCILLLLQCLWLPSALRPVAWIGLLYLLWATLLMLITAAVLRDISVQRLARRLALALGLAALINACNVILFQAGLRTGLEWGFLHTDRAGNLGQANMLADLLWLGIVSVLYCWHGSRGNGWRYAAWLAPLLVASALTGARAPLLYALWVALAAALLCDARMRRAAASVAVIYFAIVIFVYWLPVPIAGGSDSLSRMLPPGGMAAGAGAAGEAAASNIRVQLMAVAADIFLDHPWLGAGWGSFAWESFSRADDLRGTMMVGEHAHQLFFQLAADLGIAAPVLVLAALCGWALPIWRARRDLRADPAHWWAVSAAGVMLLHSQLEYPLWYAHTLGLLAIVLACSEQRKWRFEAWRGSTLAVGAVMAAGAWLLAGSIIDYRRLEQWMYADMRRGAAAAPAGHYQVLGELSRDSLLRPQAVRALAAVMLPTREQLDGKLEVCRLALRSEPQTPAVFSCALLDALAGDTALAERNMRQARRVFENEFQDYRRRLKSDLTPAQLAEHRRLLDLPAQE